MTRPARSWLFVPADSARKIDKALASEADAIILDLEDSVAESRKDEARRIAADALAGAGEAAARCWVRVNPLSDARVTDDVAAVRTLPIAGLVLPKSESGGDVARLAAMLGDTQLAIHAIVTETAASLFGLGSYAGAPRIAAMSWGAEDLSAALGASSKWDNDGNLTFTYRMARSLCLAGAVAADVQPVDGIFADFRNGVGLLAEAVSARREGFAGKLAIHPDQVGIINSAFTPTDAEVAAARRIVEAFAASPDTGTIAVEGRMLDRPHLVAAKRTLATAR